MRMIHKYLAMLYYIICIIISMIATWIIHEQKVNIFDKNVLTTIWLIGAILFGIVAYYAWRYTMGKYGAEHVVSSKKYFAISCITMVIIIIAIILICYNMFDSWKREVDIASNLIGDLYTISMLLPIMSGLGVWHLLCYLSKKA